ncbi:MAG: HD domain-containing protein [Saprospiraceae bacterium]|nr:HD domain-containing protein [Saprospiraceae bacterium]
MPIYSNHLINDPIYGPIEIPSGLIAQVVAHPYFQRLRRISQLSFAHYVFPGATHNRFSHALGALHLTQRAIRELRSKEVEITDEEAEALMLAILLHDLGHAPFSHSLEFILLDIHHEDLSILLMEALNEEFDGKLDLCLAIFKDEYPKKFLHQLVSSQLDMDRLDYLSRDSFFTGVSEGIINYKRLLKMLDVYEGELIFSHKGVYSVEQFLMARRHMYWQVYLHKTVFCTSDLLCRIVKRAKELIRNGENLPVSKSLYYFLQKSIDTENLNSYKSEILKHYPLLDDIDIINALKQFSQHGDFIISYLSSCLLNRQLFKVKQLEDPMEDTQLDKLRQKASAQFSVSAKDSQYLVFVGEQSNQAYQLGTKEIKIRLKDGSLHPISTWKEYTVSPKKIKKYYVCYPKQLEFFHSQEDYL